MLDHIKRMWGYYVALMIVIAFLAFPIYWIYLDVLHILGSEAGRLSLTLIGMVVVLLGVRGAVHTHTIRQALRQQLAASNSVSHPEPIADCLVLRLLGIELSQSPQLPIESEAGLDQEIQKMREVISCSRKRRGKQPRFPEAKIRSAVLKWESRDPSFSARTLEEFLEQEFGSGPDGILLMAPTTFYDWRRRILKELETHEDQHDLNRNTGG